MSDITDEVAALGALALLDALPLEAERVSFSFQREQALRQELQKSAPFVVAFIKVGQCGTS